MGKEILSGHNLVYFAPEKWAGLWRNRQQLMSVFARDNKVLFVEPRPGLRRMFRDWRQGRFRFDDRGISLRQVDRNLFVLAYPAWAPTIGRAPLRQMTRLVRQAVLQGILEKLEMAEPIIWFSRPDMLDLLAEIPPARLLLYHVVDDYSAYSGKTLAARQRIIEQEKKMLARVDAVIVVSQKLYEDKCSVNASTYLVPNGVNYQAYSTALAEPGLPAGLQRIKSPRLGYSGLIGDRLDLVTLQKLAQANPDWSLIFLGEARFVQEEGAWSNLQALPNVHYLGAVEASQVPSYVKGFDVGLIPYRQGRESDGISPLKLYDYLAAGIPVAAIDFPAAREFSRYIHLAQSPANFAEAVGAALFDTGPERKQLRRQVAALHTWEARVEQISQIIQARLAAKASARAAH